MMSAMARSCHSSCCFARPLKTLFPAKNYIPSHLNLYSTASTASTASNPRIGLTTIHTTSRPVSKEIPLQRVVVVGGGISGLSTAWFLKQHHPHLHVSVVEQSKHLGGWVHSVKLPLTASCTDGSADLNTVRSAPVHHLVETGPRTLRPGGTAGASTLEMIHSLDLSSDILMVSKSSPAAKNRFIYFDNKLNQLPHSLLGMLTTSQPIFKGVLGSLLREAFQLRQPVSNIQKSVATLGNTDDHGDESVESFIVRRFGQKVADNLVSAIMHGIYSGDISYLSARSTMGAIWEKERHYGSITAGMIANALGLKTPSEIKAASNVTTQEISAMLDTTPAKKFIERVQAEASIYSFHGGMQVLTDRLVERLLCLGVNFVHDKCVSISQNQSGFKVDLANETTLDAEYIVSAVPSHILAQLLEPLPITPLLEKTRSATVGVVNLVYRGENLQRQQGFGYLLPRNESLLAGGMLGCIFDSSTMPTQDSAAGFTRLTVMVGGQFNKGFGSGNISDVGTDVTEEILSGLKCTAAEMVQQHLQIDGSLLEVVRGEVLRDCIPQYGVGHAECTEQVLEYIQQRYQGRLSLVGASYLGVSVNDCVYRARYVASQIGKLVSAHSNDIRAR
ncbi:hypothetical protein BASA61_008979 [Batrachochytrium salamandrivorans]|nr:hypothetical protein BASA61_008979 [Batrachochytrium salamandrivorans]KAH9267701.1 protoporphyrinogen oxidase [Batrachochytrium salamandrivorans]